MQVKQRVWLIGIALVGLAALLFHEQAARFLIRLREPQRTQPAVAHLAQTEGSVLVRYYQATDFEPARPAPLSLGDSLKTERGGRARLNFQSGYSLELEGDSQVTFEKQINGDALVLNLIRGSISLLQEGEKAQLLVLENGFLREPGGRTPTEPLRVQSGAPGTSAAVVNPPDLNEAGSAPPEMQGSLSTEYIVSIIQGQKAFFNRCYAAHLQSSPYSKGNMNFSFTIESSGRVSDIRLLSSTIADETLQKCVATVLERCRFRAFDSKPIIANYPIIFE